METKKEVEKDVVDPSKREEVKPKKEVQAEKIIFKKFKLDTENRNAVHYISISDTYKIKFQAGRVYTAKDKGEEKALSNDPMLKVTK